MSVTRMLCEKCGAPLCYCGCKSESFSQSVMREVEAIKGRERELATPTPVDGQDAPIARCPTCNCLGNYLRDETYKIYVCPNGHEEFNFKMGSQLKFMDNESSEPVKIYSCVGCSHNIRGEPDWGNLTCACCHDDNIELKAKDCERRNWKSATPLKPDILERLLNYNPPDRTYDSQRKIAEDIQEAAEEIMALRDCLGVDKLGMIPNVHNPTAQDVMDVLDDEDTIESISKDYEGMSSKWIMHHYRAAVKERVVAKAKES